MCEDAATLRSYIEYMENNASTPSRCLIQLWCYRTRVQANNRAAEYCWSALYISCRMSTFSPARVFILKQLEAGVI